MEDLVALGWGLILVALGFVLGDRYRSRRSRALPAAPVTPPAGPADGIGALMAAGLEARRRGDSAEAARCFHASADLVSGLLGEMLDEKLAQTRH